MHATTEKILQLLHLAGGFVSGEELCGEFSMTRSAIWKHIGHLRKLGCQIQAHPGLGYRLDGLSGMPVAAEVTPWLTTKRLGRKLDYLDIADSTNLVARSLAREGRAEGTVVVADSQTQAHDIATTE